MASAPALSIRVAANLTDLKAALATGASMIGEVTAGMQKLANSLDGAKVIQQATNIVGAIQSVGGASTLTAAQADRLGATLDLAAAKLQALGQSVPGLDALRSQLKAVADQSDSWLGGLTDKAIESAQGFALASLGISSAQEALRTLMDLAAEPFELAKRATEAGEAIGTMALKTGTSVSAMSALGAASRAAGSDSTTLTNAMFTLDKNLDSLGASGNNARTALASLGISAQSFTLLSPDQQVLALSNAFRSLPDGANAATTAFELFNRQGRDILPTLLRPLEQLTDQSHALGLTWSGEEAEAAERLAVQSRQLDDVWQRLQDRIGEGLIPALTQLVEWLKKHNDAVIAAQAAAALFGQAAGDMVGQPIVETERAVTNSVSAFTIWRAVLASTIPGLSALAPPTREATDDTNQLASSFLNAESAHQRWLQQQAALHAQEEADAAKKAAEALKQWNDEVQRMADTLSGADLDKKVQQTAQAIQTIGGVAHIQAAELPALVKQIGEWLSAGEKLPPLLVNLFNRNTDWTFSTKLATTTLSEFQQKILGITPPIVYYGKAAQEAFAAPLQPLLQFNAALDEFNQKAQSLEGKSLASMFPNAKAGADSFKLFMDSIAPAKQKTSEWDVALRQVTDDFRSMASVTTGTMSLVADDLAKATQATKTFGDSISLLGKGPGSTDANGNIIGGAAGVANIIGGITGVIGAVVSLGSAIASALGIGQTAGRDLVVQFADAQGGFDSLHAKLGELGDEGERMWKRLAAVGQNDPLGAQSAIAQVNQDLKVIDFADAEGGMDELHRKLDALGPAGEQMWQVLQSGGPAAVSMIDHAKDALGSMSQSAQNIAAVMGEGPQDALKDLNNDISKYKVSIDQLGPAWKQQNLTVEAQDLIGSYTRLTDAGVKTTDVISDMSGIVTDTNGKITGFSGGLNQLLNDAISTGAALPDQFQPILQQMVDMGDAVDANGNKIKDLSGVKFDQSLDQQFKTLIDHIDDLIKKLTDGLNPALLNIPSPTVTVGVNYDYGNGPIPPGAKGGLAADTGNAGSSDSGNSDPSQWGVPVGDSPLTSVTKSGLVYLKPGDIYGMPHLTAGLGAGVSTSAAPLAGSSGGGQMVVNNAFAIYQQPGESSDELAVRIVDRINNKGSLRTSLVNQAVIPTLKQAGYVVQAAS